MSAYMVDREHVHFLIEAASRMVTGRGRGHMSLNWIWNVNREAGTYERNHLYPSEWGKLSKLGQLLWDENRRSIEHRYPDTREDFSGAPGPIGEDFIYGEHESSWEATIDPKQVIRSCACYVYQASEHPGWETSEAKAFVEALKNAAVDELLDGADLAWGAPKGWVVPSKKVLR